MFNLFWVIFVLCLCLVLLRWRSPILLISPYLLLASVTTPFSTGDTLSLNLIMLSWMMTVMIVAIYLHSREIRIDGFEEVQANYAKMTPRNFIWMSIALILMISVIWLWFVQAGVNQFDSSKRARESGPWFHLVNALINFFVLHATITLSIFRLRLANPHILIALLSLAMVFVIGYVSSSRGVFVVPLLTIFLFRVLRMRSIYSRLKLLAAFSLLAPIVLISMALIASERRGEEGLGVGFAILGEQLSDSETGYGFSPARDAIVWEYSISQSRPEVAIALLGGFYGLVPRALWPGKPTFVGTGPIAGAFVIRGQSYVDQGAGIPISMPSEIALAFGNEWFLLGVIATAIVMVLAAELLRLYPLLIFASLTFYAGLMSHGLPKSQIELFVDVISLLILSRATGIRVVRNGVPLVQVITRKMAQSH